MQQIDEIKRMSELARQMRELGLAKSNSDAFEQARSVTSSDPAVAAQRKQEEAQNRLASLERKYEAQAKTIDDLKAKLTDEDQRLADVLSKLSSLSAKMRDLELASTQNIAPIPQQWQPPMPPQLAQQAAPQQWPAQPAQQEMPQPAQQPWGQAYPPQMRVQPPSAQPIDRNGVAPSEISVEKFFYCGNRK